MKESNHVAPSSRSSASLTMTGNDGTLPSNVLTTAIALINVPPTVDAIPDPSPILEDSGQRQIVLTGISAGSGEIHQDANPQSNPFPGQLP